MEVTSASLYTANTVLQILEAIQKAQVPPKFSNPFLQALGFKSTNDRAFINVWKGLGFLDGGSAPTEHYKAFRDKFCFEGRVGATNPFCLQRPFRS